MNTNLSETKKRTMFMVLFASILAIEAIISFSPLGSLPAIGPIFATTFHIPVVITGILMGPIAGGFMGSFAGLFSFLVWTFVNPALPAAFLFTPFGAVGKANGSLWSLVICFLPRILTGMIAGIAYKGLKGKIKNNFLLYFLSGIFGSLTNTFGVLIGASLFLTEPYKALALGTYKFLFFAVLLTVVTSGIPEAVLGGLSSYAVCFPAKKYMFKNELSIFTDKNETMIPTAVIVFTVMLYIIGAIVN